MMNDMLNRLKEVLEVSVDEGLSRIKSNNVPKTPLSKPVTSLNDSVLNVTTKFFGDNIASISSKSLHFIRSNFPSEEYQQEFVKYQQQESRPIINGILQPVIVPSTQSNSQQSTLNLTSSTLNLDEFRKKLAKVRACDGLSVTEILDRKETIKDEQSTEKVLEELARQKNNPDQKIVELLVENGFCVSENTNTTDTLTSTKPQLQNTADCTNLVNSTTTSISPCETTVKATPAPPNSQNSVFRTKSPTIPKVAHTAVVEPVVRFTNSSPSSQAPPPPPPTAPRGQIPHIRSFTSFDCDTPTPRSPISQANFLCPKQSTKACKTNVEPPILTLSDILLEVRVKSIEKHLIKLMHKVSGRLF